MAGNDKRASYLRRNARRKGQKTYFTGFACKYGHVGARWVLTAKCLSCRERLNELNRNWGIKDIETRKRNIVNRVKAQAKMKGILFDISVRDVEWNEYCPILDIPLNYFTKGGRQQNSVSLDRVNPDLGYVNGNVSVISLRANSIKSNLSLTQAKRLVDYIEKRLRRKDDSTKPAKPSTQKLVCRQ